MNLRMIGGIIVAVLASAACSEDGARASGTGGAKPDSTQENATVTATITQPTAIPPIDRNPPAKTELATFAMG